MTYTIGQKLYSIHGGVGTVAQGMVGLVVVFGDNNADPRRHGRMIDPETMFATQDEARAAAPRILKQRKEIRARKIAARQDRAERAAINYERMNHHMSGAGDVCETD